MTFWGSYVLLKMSSPHPTPPKTKWCWCGYWLSYCVENIILCNVCNIHVQSFLSCQHFAFLERSILLSVHYSKSILYFNSRRHCSGDIFTSQYCFSKLRNVVLIFQINFPRRILFLPYLYRVSQKMSKINASNNIMKVVQWIFTMRLLSNKSIIMEYVSKKASCYGYSSLWINYFININGNKLINLW